MNERREKCESYWAFDGLKQGSVLNRLSIGTLFQRFMTRSVKQLDLTELLQKYFKILQGWPLVEQKVISVHMNKPK